MLIQEENWHFSSGLFLLEPPHSDFGLHHVDALNYPDSIPDIVTIDTHSAQEHHKPANNRENAVSESKSGKMLRCRHT